MKKNIILNVAGIVALSLLGACGTCSKQEASKEDVKHAEVEIPVTEAVAQAEIDNSLQQEEIAQVAIADQISAEQIPQSVDNNAPLHDQKA